MRRALQEWIDEIQPARVQQPLFEADCPDAELGRLIADFERRRLPERILLPTGTVQDWGSVFARIRDPTARPMDRLHAVLLVRRRYPLNNYTPAPS